MLLIIIFFASGFLSGVCAFIANRLGNSEDALDTPSLLKEQERRKTYFSIGFIVLGLLAGVTGAMAAISALNSNNTVPVEPPPRQIGKPSGSSDSFPIYANYDPSGYMGDVGDLIVERYPELIRFTYETMGRGPHEWEYKYINNELNVNLCQFAGVMFLDPPNNWGEVATGGFDLRGRRVVKWEARSLTVPTHVEFVMGGIAWRWNDGEKERVDVPYPDSMPQISMGVRTLTEEWQLFEKDLSDLSEDYFRSVVGGFGWVISWGSNRVRLNETRTGSDEPQTFIFELRNIRFER